MRRRTELLIILAFVVLGLLIWSLGFVAGKASAAERGFVTASGGQFQVNGKPFFFTGFNIYNANTRNNCANPPVNLGGDQAAVAAQLTQMGPGTEVVRVWFFEQLATSSGARDWRAFDATLAAARASGKRVIATLGNQWPDCEGSSAFYKTQSWYDTGYKALRNPGGLGTYRQWLTEVSARYRDDPAIMMWQLMNEAEAVTAYGGTCLPSAPLTLRRFADDAGGALRAQDGRHLISLGTVGADNCGMQGDAYKTIHASPAIDVCEFHDWYGDGPLRTRIQQCKSLGKPLFVGEAGLIPNEVGGRQARADRFDEKIRNAQQWGAQGYLLWTWMASGTRDDYHDIGPGDPAIATVNR